MYRALILLIASAIAVAVLAAAGAASAQTSNRFASEEEKQVCGLIKSMCRKVNGIRVNDQLCTSAKKIKSRAGYQCGKDRGRATGELQSCRGFVQQGRGSVVALSVDSKNRNIFGYCVKGSGQAARECAYQACVEKGGRYCGLPCNPQNGKEIRACRTEVVTIVTADDYTRLGCGARHVRAGNHTFDSYVKRELGRCLGQSKSPGSCRLEAAWQ